MRVKMLLYWSQATGFTDNSPNSGFLFGSYLSSEYKSSKLFWMGVPVTAHLARALNWHTAIEVCTLGFLILWASSKTILAQATRSRGGECGALWNRERKEFHADPPPPLRIILVHMVARWLPLSLHCTNIGCNFLYFQWRAKETSQLGIAVWS